MIFVGAVGLVFQATVVYTGGDLDGQPVNLADAERMWFTIRRPRQPEVEVRDATIADGETNVLEYTNVAGDLPREGTYSLQAWVQMNPDLILPSTVHEFRVHEQ